MLGITGKQTEAVNPRRRLDPGPPAQQTAAMLIGKTVALRPVEKSDVPLLTRWWNDPAAFDSSAARWPTRSAEIEARVARKPNYEKRGEFLVVLTETLGTDHETAVGHYSYISPFRFPLSRCLEIGYSTFVEHRRKGYAAMAGRLLVNQLFNATQVHRIQAHCLTTNGPSQRVMEAIGMTHEATLRGFIYESGIYHDVHLYAIVRPEWKDCDSYAARSGSL
jgi:RimJ/RimL family protein N-acetyltransferase